MPTTPEYAPANLIAGLRKCLDGIDRIVAEKPWLSPFITIPAEQNRPFVIALLRALEAQQADSLDAARYRAGRAGVRVSVHGDFIPMPDEPHNNEDVKQAYDRYIDAAMQSDTDKRETTTQGTGLKVG